MRSLLRSVVIVVLLMVTMQAPLVQASDGWCDTDPIMVIRTPAGRLVPVYVTVGAQNLLFTPNTLLGSLVLSYTAVPTKDGTATRVAAVVNVPSSPLYGSSFATRNTASTGAYGTGLIYAQASGVSGQPTTLKFVLPYP
jgi:hypothetical protein